MKKLNLKLGGIKEMLSREQMKKVVGGDGYGYGYSPTYDLCTFKYTSPTGVVTTTPNSTPVAGGSDGARQACVSYVGSNPGSRCGFDCMADGWGK